MRSKSEFATTQLAGGLGCAASVLSAFCEDYGLDVKKAAKIACGLGGGCATGEVCGAVTGALLVVGLKFGQETVEDMDAKADCRAHVLNFISKFKETNSALTCRDLLGCDITTEEGFAVYLEKRGTVCPTLVKSAVEILEELGY